jgi:hypothetical protein
LWRKAPLAPESQNLSQGNPLLLEGEKRKTAHRIQSELAAFTKGDTGDETTQSIGSQPCQFIFYATSFRGYRIRWAFSVPPTTFLTK